MKYLITGITGQDGLHLTSKILSSANNDSVLGITRTIPNKSFFKNLEYLIPKADLKSVELSSIDMLKSYDVEKIISDYRPDMIFNLSGPSSVYNSFANPQSTVDSIYGIFNNLVNACVKNNNFCSFFQPSSSEMFKDSKGERLTEKSELEPLSPYAQAKYSVHNQVKEIRDKYDWNINSGILFNHESEFRKNDYLFMKVINSAIAIKNGHEEKITLGSLDLIRDWSYAGDIANAIFLMTKNDVKKDYVIGSGDGNSIELLVNKVFSYFNLDFKDYISLDKKLLRKNTPKTILANPEKIRNELGWQVQVKFDELIEKCISYKLTMGS